jgi:hypothetical protein
MYAKESSPYLGFISDFGAAATRVSPAFIQYFRQLHVPEALIAIVREEWMKPDDPSAVVPVVRTVFVDF